MRLTYGSLFSGIGGFDLGFDRAGWDCSWQVEIDPQARSVLRRHWPDVTKYQDVREVGSANLTPAYIICGGFPCQDLSVAGRRAGLVGEDSGLFYEFARILGELSPQWVLLENVPGLLSANRGRDMGTVLGTLGELGYWWTYRILDAQYFGVAQQRRRVFVVGHLGGPCPPEVLLEPESLPGDRSPRDEAEEEPAAAAVGCSSRARARGIKYAPLVSPAIKARDSKGVSSDAHGDGAPLVVQAFSFAENQRGELRASDVAPALGVQGEKPGQGYSAAIQDGKPRRLTPRECERLQGFPDDWTRWADDGREIKDGPRYRMLGNAVAVPVAEWIARRIKGKKKGT